MRSKFEEQLSLLNKEMIEMGAMCEQAISLASDAMLGGDMSLVPKVLDSSHEIDRKEREIESLCLKLLLQQQPVARDLRQISAALKMITDMERIGDQAGDIAEMITYLDGRAGDECSFIGEMAHQTIYMVTHAVDAFVRRNVTLADQVVLHDDVVDQLFDKVKHALIDMITQNPAAGEYALDLMMIAKYFERIGDHAVGIAQWVSFSVTGNHKGATI